MSARAPQDISEAARLLTEIQEKYGLTQKAIADRLGRTKHMMSKVARGLSAGDLYVPALRELLDTGAVSSPPPRRRDAHGRTVPVRTSKTAPPPQPTLPGTGEAESDELGDGLIRPQDPQPYAEPVKPKRPRQKAKRKQEPSGPEAPAKPARTPRRPPVQYSERRSSFEKGATLLHQTVPHTKTAVGYTQAEDAWLKNLQSRARGQRHGDKQVQVHVKLSNGMSAKLYGNYGWDVSKILSTYSSAKQNGLDFHDFLLGQVNKKYKADKSDKDLSIIDIQTLSYYKSNNPTHQHGSTFDSINPERNS